MALNIISQGKVSLAAGLLLLALPGVAMAVVYDSSNPQSTVSDADIQGAINQSERNHSAAMGDDVRDAQGNNLMINGQNARQPAAQGSQQGYTDQQIHDAIINKGIAETQGNGGEVINNGQTRKNASGSGQQRPSDLSGAPGTAGPNHEIGINTALAPVQQGLAALNSAASSLSSTVNNMTSQLTGGAAGSPTGSQGAGGQPGDNDVKRCNTDIENEKALPAVGAAMPADCVSGNKNLEMGTKEDSQFTPAIATATLGANGEENMNFKNGLATWQERYQHFVIEIPHMIIMNRVGTGDLILRNGAATGSGNSSGNNGGRV